MFRQLSAMEWKERFVDAGLDERVFDALAKANLMKDYEALFYQFNRLPEVLHQEFRFPWQLVCLSGNTDAFNQALENGYFKNVQNTNLNPLHCAVLSGVPEQIHNALKLGFEVTPTATDTLKTIGKLNILHLAVLSRVEEQINTVLKLEQADQLPFTTTDEEQRNILHLAAWTGNIDILNAVLQLVKNDISIKDGKGFNALNYAIYGNNQRVIKTLQDAGLEPSGNQDAFTFGQMPKLPAVPENR